MSETSGLHHTSFEAKFDVDPKRILVHRLKIEILSSIGAIHSQGSDDAVNWLAEAEYEA